MNQCPACEAAVPMGATVCPSCELSLVPVEFEPLLLQVDRQEIILAGFDDEMSAECFAGRILSLDFNAWVVPELDAMNHFAGQFPPYTLRVFTSDVRAILLSLHNDGLWDEAEFAGHVNKLGMYE